MGPGAGVYPLAPIGPCLGRSGPSGLSFTTPGQKWESGGRLSTCPGVSSEAEWGHHGWSRLALTEFPAWEAFPRQSEALLARGRRTEEKVIRFVVAWMPGECSQEPVCGGRAQGGSEEIGSILSSVPYSTGQFLLGLSPFSAWFIKIQTG